MRFAWSPTQLLEEFSRSVAAGHIKPVKVAIHFIEESDGALKPPQVWSTGYAPHEEVACAALSLNQAMARWQEDAKGLPR